MPPTGHGARSVSNAGRMYDARDAVRQAALIGVYDTFPENTLPDGVLGNNFLRHFKLTVDRAAREVVLAL